MSSWCSGYHVRLTRGRSPVQAWPETRLLYNFLFWVMTKAKLFHYPIPRTAEIVSVLKIAKWVNLFQNFVKIQTFVIFWVAKSEYFVYKVTKLGARSTKLPSVTLKGNLSNRLREIIIQHH